GRNHAHDPYVAYSCGLLDRDHLRTREAISLMVDRTAQWQAVDGYIPGPRRPLPIRPCRSRNVAGGVFRRSCKRSCQMKKYFRHLEAIRAKLGRGKQLLAVSLIALILLPGTARAAGLTDIITLLTTITSTIQNA